MSLPQLTSPEFVTKVPSTGKEITYRPFLVREEKILLMALEGGDEKEISKAITNILTSCILSDVKIDEDEVGYHASDLTNQQPLTFYLEKEDRDEVMKILENVRDNKDLQTKNNALLYIARKHK